MTFSSSSSSYILMSLMCWQRVKYKVVLWSFIGNGGQQEIEQAESDAQWHKSTLRRFLGLDDTTCGWNTGPMHQNHGLKCTTRVTIVCVAPSGAGATRQIQHGRSSTKCVKFTNICDSPGAGTTVAGTRKLWPVSATYHTDTTDSAKTVSPAYEGIFTNSPTSSSITTSPSVTYGENPA